MRSFLASPILAVLLTCGLRSGVAQTSNSAPLAPLPNANEILQRALANERKLASERERYECRVTTTAIETDSRGNTKKNTTEVKDQFFVTASPSSALFKKTGKTLRRRKPKRKTTA